MTEISFFLFSIKFQFLLSKSPSNYHLLAIISINIILIINDFVKKSTQCNKFL